MIICVKNLYGKKFLINKFFLWGNNVSYQMCHCQLLLLALRRRRRICGAKEIKVAKEKDWKRRGLGLQLLQNGRTHSAGCHSGSRWGS